MKVLDAAFLITFTVLVVFATTEPVRATMVDHIAFTTAPQAISFGVISGVITIQTQDVSGVSVAVGVTSDLTLTSTSPTGEFSESALDWDEDNFLTMNSNWHNKSFYYRDNTAGDFVLTAILTERQLGGASWQAMQNVTITPEPTTILLCLVGRVTVLRRWR